MIVNFSTGEIIEPLTVDERSVLTDAESKIERGLTSFIEVGEALGQVNDSRLYRETHGTFDAYCLDRWNLGRTRAYQLINAATAASTIVDAPLPANEGQARELTGLEPDVAADVMRWAHEATGGKPTALSIRNIRKELEGARAQRRTIPTRVEAATVIQPKQESPARPAEMPDLPKFSDWMSENTQAPEPGEASTTSSPFSGSDERGEQNELPAVSPASVDLSDFINSDPTVRLTSWRKHFMAAIAKSSDLLLFTPDDVAENAGADLINELERLASDLNNYVARVRAKRPTHLTALRGGKQ